MPARSRGIPRNSTYMVCPSDSSRAPAHQALRAKAGNATITWGSDAQGEREGSSNLRMAVQTPSKGNRSRVRGTPQGRAVDPSAREDVRALLGDAPRRR